MKRLTFYIIVLILFVFVVSITPLYGRELVVNGNTYDVEIPSDMTAEDAFFEAFQLYLEAEEDCKRATEALKSTTEQLESLKEEVVSAQKEMEGYISALTEVNALNVKLKDEYRELSSEYEELSSIYKKMLRPVFLSPYLGVGIDRDMATETFTPSVQIGAVIFEKFNVTTNMEYIIKDNGWSFGLQVGMKF